MGDLNGHFYLKKSEKKITTRFIAKTYRARLVNCILKITCRFFVKSWSMNYNMKLGAQGRRR